MELGLAMARRRKRSTLRLMKVNTAPSRPQMTPMTSVGTKTMGGRVAIGGLWVMGV